MASLRSTAVTRRGLVRGGISIGGGLAAATLISCGSSKSKAPSSVATATGAQSSASAATPGGAQPSSSTSNRRYARVVVQSDKPPKAGGSLAISIAQDVGSFDT